MSAGLCFGIPTEKGDTLPWKSAPEVWWLEYRLNRQIEKDGIFAPPLEVGWIERLGESGILAVRDSVQYADPCQNPYTVDLPAFDGAAFKQTLADLGIILAGEARWLMWCE